MRIPRPRRAFALLAASGVLASFAATASGSALSTADVFNVELVVFRYGGTLSSAENWDVTPLPGATTTTGTTGTTGLAAQAAPADAGSQPDSIKALNPGQFQLAGTEAVLGRDADYLPLAHFGFRLVAGGRDAGTPVRIESMVDAASGLTGTVTLERGRFLHLAVDLTYTTSNPPPALLPPNTPPATVTFQMHQDRRMRPFERHYFDHPAFGVVAIITPVTARGGND